MPTPTDITDITDITDNEEIKKLQQAFNDKFKINNGKGSLTVVPKTVSRINDGEIGIADIMLKIEGDTGINYSDGVNEMLYGLFKSAELFSNNPNVNKPEDDDGENRTVTPEDLYQELQKAFPKSKEYIYDFKPTVFRTVDINNPFSKVQNGQEYPIGGIIKRVGDFSKVYDAKSEGGNKKKQSTKNKKTKKKRSQKLGRKTKGKKNTVNHKKNKVVKNGKKK